MNRPETREAVYNAIDAERQRQQQLHPDKTCADRMAQSSRYLILAEEVGEVAAALQDLHSKTSDRDGWLQARDHLHDELVQVAAVAVAWLEGTQ